MINEVDILHESHSSDFTCHPYKKSTGLLCVVSYHYKVIVELGEYCFNAFAKSSVSPRRLPPILLIQPTWGFKINVCLSKRFFCTSVLSVSKHHAVMIFPTNIIKKTNIMHTCDDHIIGIYDSAYFADSMEFIFITVYSLQCAISLVRNSIGIVTPHCTASCPCILAYLDRFGINEEYVFGLIYGNNYILTDFSRKSNRQFTADIKLSSTNQVWQIILAFFMQTMKQKVLTIEPKSFYRYVESDDFEIANFRLTAKKNSEKGNRPHSRVQSVNALP